MSENLYVIKLIELTKKTTEEFLNTVKGVTAPTFHDLGLTDSLIILYAKKCKLLITADSKLSNYATGSGIKVYDLVKEKNKKLNEDN